MEALFSGDAERDEWPSSSSQGVATLTPALAMALDMRGLSLFISDIRKAGGLQHPPGWGS